MSTRRPRHSANQWASIIERFEQSNLTVNAFCEQQNIAKATFSKWQRRIRQRSSDESPAFTQVKTAEPVPPNVPAKPASLITLRVGPNVTLTIASEAPAS